MALNSNFTMKYNSLIRETPPRRRVKLNVGGRMFTTWSDTLTKLPDSRLGRLTANSPEYDAGGDEFFFDRNPAMFDSVLDIYRTGQIHFPKCTCGAFLKQELEFWEICEEHVSDCCWKVYKRYDEDREQGASLDALLTKYQQTERELANNLPRSRWSLWRLKLLLLLEDPTSSKAAMVWGVLYLIMVMFSVSALCITTHPVARFQLDEPKWNVSMIQNSKLLMYATTDLYYSLWYIDVFCLVIFTMDLVVRFIVSLDKKDFCKSGYNIIDLVAIVPGICVFVLDSASFRFYESRQNYNVIFCLTLLGVFRIFRLVKFARHYTAMRVLLLALRASVREILLLLMLIVMGMLIFSTLIYFAEFECASGEIDTIPYGFWWSIVTMTTVGYGDIKPTTGWGYLVGGLCALVGMLCTGLPIPIIASNFNLHISYFRDNMRLKQRYREAGGKKDNTPDILGKTFCGTGSDVMKALEAGSKPDKPRRRRRKYDSVDKMPVTHPVYVKNATFLGNNIRTYTNYGNESVLGSHMTSSDDDDCKHDSDVRRSHPTCSYAPDRKDVIMSYPENSGRTPIYHIRRPSRSKVKPVHAAHHGRNMMSPYKRSVSAPAPHMAAHLYM